MKRNIMLEVAELIATNPVSKLLRTSDIRTAGAGYGESGGQRLREHAKRFRLKYGQQPYEYAGHGYYKIYGPFKRDMQRYVREHQN
jgi:hypothetical protein